MGVLSILNSVILAFLVAEFIRTIFFTKEWVYRFNKNPTPLENWKKGLIITIMFVFIFPLINWVFTKYVSRLLEGFGYYQISLFFIFAPAAYLWIEKRTLSLVWEKRDAIPIAIILLSIIFTLIFRFY